MKRFLMLVCLSFVGASCGGASDDSTCCCRRGVDPPVYKTEKRSACTGNNVACVESTACQ